jgi:hypothetical protein
MMMKWRWGKQKQKLARRRKGRGKRKSKKKKGRPGAAVLEAGRVEVATSSVLAQEGDNREVASFCTQDSERVSVFLLPSWLFEQVSERAATACVRVGRRRHDGGA